MCLFFTLFGENVANLIIIYCAFIFRSGLVNKKKRSSRLLLPPSTIGCQVGHKYQVATKMAKEGNKCEVDTVKVLKKNLKSGKSRLKGRQKRTKKWKERIWQTISGQKVNSIRKLGRHTSSKSYKNGQRVDKRWTKGRQKLDKR